MCVAWKAPVVQILVPLTFQPPSTRSARVRTDARSEPESGSLIPIENENSPLAIPGRKDRFCSSVPLAAMLGPDCLSPIQ